MSHSFGGWVSNAVKFVRLMLIVYSSKPEIFDKKTTGFDMGEAIKQV